MKKHLLSGITIGMIALLLSLSCYAQGDGGKKKRKPVKTEQTHTGSSKPKPTGQNNVKPKPNKPSATVSQPTGSINGHGYVDLGLSVKWATMNVGASSPSGYGNYYAWGEARPKSDYTWANCFDCFDSSGKSWREYKIGGKTQISSTSGHDTARENWGGGWRMPTVSELEELNNKCTWTWTKIDGHNGYKVTGPNGNSIFLPAAGFRSGTGISRVDQSGLYWSGSLSSSNSNLARGLYFYDGDHYLYYNDRRNGRSVRPVIE